MNVLVYSHRIGYRTITFIHNELEYLDKHPAINLSVLYHLHGNENEIKLSKSLQIKHYENSYVGLFLNVVNQLLPKSIQYNSFSKQLIQIIEENKIDLFHIHFGNIAVRVLEHLPTLPIPTLIHFHGHDASQQLQSRKYCDKLQKIFARKNVYPIFVSDFMKKNLINKGLHFHSSFRLFYGIKTVFFKRQHYTNSKKPYIFLQISSFVEKKGHQYTLEAYKTLIERYPDRETLLILAGGGPLLETIKNQAQILEIEQYVRFTGWINHQKANELMQQAHCFVHHSVTSSTGDQEGIPNAIIEAMAMELPIISTYHAGVPELVEDGVNGFLVSEKDVLLYSQRMSDIMTWNYKRENRTKVENQFSYTVHGQKLIGIYHHLNEEYQ